MGCWRGQAGGIRGRRQGEVGVTGESKGEREMVTGGGEGGSGMGGGAGGVWRGVAGSRVENGGRGGSANPHAYDQIRDC